MKKSVYLSSLLAICCSLFAVKASAQVPVVGTNPVNDTICTTDTTYFHIDATGTTPISFMWEVSSDGGTMWDTVRNGAVYSGADNDTLMVIANMSLNMAMYRCQAINADGADTSDAAMLTVDTAYAGMISAITPICVGSTITLTSSVAGGTWYNLHLGVDTTDPTGMLEARGFGWDTVIYTVTNTCGVSTTSAPLRVDTVAMPMPITGPIEVCVGNMITLANANRYGTATWSVGMTGNAVVSTSGVVTGVANGLDTVTYSFSNACGMVADVTMEVYVDTLLAAGSITGASAVCSGSWIHLSSSVSGGIWLSGATSVAVVSAAGNVTGVSQGTSIISYYQANACGASFSSHAVTVEVVAGPITGNDSVGIDSMILLGNIAPGGMWTSVDTSIAKIDTFTGWTTGRDTGMTTIVYSLSNSCGISSSSLTMFVGPLPSAGTLSGSDTVCVGSSIALTPSISGGTWISRHDTLATVSDTGLVTGVEFGIDTVDYYVTTAFGRSRVWKRIVINQPPIVTVDGPASVALGGSYSLVASPVGGTWTGNNPVMAPLIGDGFFVVIDTGTTVFTYSRSNTCGTTTATFSIHLAGVSSVSGTDGFNGLLSIYPNPSTGTITVNVPTAVNEALSVVITNVAGQKVKEMNIISNTPSQIAIDQPSGVYLLTAVTADGSVHTARISITN